MPRKRDPLRRLEDELRRLAEYLESLTPSEVEEFNAVVARGVSAVARERGRRRDSMLTALAIRGKKGSS